MTISLRGGGNWYDASTGTYETVQVPAAAQVGDMLIVFAAVRPYAAAPVAQDSSWTKLGDYADGTVANGNGVGSVRIAVWWKICTDSDIGDYPAFSWTQDQSVTAAPGTITMAAYSKSDANFWVTPAHVFGLFTAVTSVSVTFGSNPGLTAGDVGIVYAASRDNSAMTVPTWTATGTTLGTATVEPVTPLNTATSNDMAATGTFRAVSSGTASAAPVFTMTQAAVETGACVFIRLRETPNNNLAVPCATATAVVGDLAAPPASPNCPTPITATASAAPMDAKLSTRLYLRTTQTTTIRPRVQLQDGSNDVADDYVRIGIEGAHPRQLSETPGAALTAVRTAGRTTEAGPHLSPGLNLGLTGTKPVRGGYQWVSDPIAYDTLMPSGPVTFNIWAYQNAAATNATIRVVIGIVSPDGWYIEAVNSSYGTNLGTTAALCSWTDTSGTVSIAPGSVIVVGLYATDADTLTMADGGTVYASYNAASGTGLSYIDFPTWGVTFSSPTPTGTVLDFGSEPVTPPIGAPPALLNKPHYLAWPDAAWANKRVTTMYTYTTDFGTENEERHHKWETPPLQGSNQLCAGPFKVTLPSVSGTDTAAWGVHVYLVPRESYETEYLIGQGIQQAATAVDIYGHMSAYISPGDRLRFVFTALPPTEADYANVFYSGYIPNMEIGGATAIHSPPLATSTLTLTLPIAIEPLAGTVVYVQAASATMDASMWGQAESFDYSNLFVVGSRYFVVYTPPTSYGYSGHNTVRNEGFIQPWNMQMQDLCYEAGTYFAVGPTGTYNASYNRETAYSEPLWTNVAIGGGTPSFVSCSFAGEYWFAATSAGALWYASDPAGTWTEITPQTLTAGEYGSLTLGKTVIFDGTYYVVVGKLAANSYCTLSSLADLSAEEWTLSRNIDGFVPISSDTPDLIFDPVSGETIWWAGRIPTTTGQAAWIASVQGDPGAEVTPAFVAYYGSPAYDLMGDQFSLSRDRGQWIMIAETGIWAAPDLWSDWQRVATFTSYYNAINTSGFMEGDVQRYLAIVKDTSSSAFTISGASLGGVAFAPKVYTTPLKTASPQVATGSGVADDAVWRAQTSIKPYTAMAAAVEADVFTLGPPATRVRVQAAHGHGSTRLLYGWRREQPDYVASYLSNVVVADGVTAIGGSSSYTWSYMILPSGGGYFDAVRGVDPNSANQQAPGAFRYDFKELVAPTDPSMSIFYTKLFYFDAVGWVALVALEPSSDVEGPQLVYRAPTATGPWTDTGVIFSKVWYGNYPVIGEAAFDNGHFYLMVEGEDGIYCSVDFQTPVKVVPFKGNLYTDAGGAQVKFIDGVWVVQTASKIWTCRPDHNSQRVLQDWEWKLRYTIPSADYQIGVQRGASLEHDPATGTIASIVFDSNTSNTYFLVASDPESSWELVQTPYLYPGGGTFFAYQGTWYASMYTSGDLTVYASTRLSSSTADWAEIVGTFTGNPNANYGKVLSTSEGTAFFLADRSELISLDEDVDTHRPYVSAVQCAEATGAAYDLFSTWVNVQCAANLPGDAWALTDPFSGSSSWQAIWAPATDGRGNWLQQANSVYNDYGYLVVYSTNDGASWSTLFNFGESYYPYPLDTQYIPPAAGHDGSGGMWFMSWKVDGTEDSGIRFRYTTDPLGPSAVWIQGSRHPSYTAGASTVHRIFHVKDGVWVRTAHLPSQGAYDYYLETATHPDGPWSTPPDLVGVRVHGFDDYYIAGGSPGALRAVWSDANYFYLYAVRWNSSSSTSVSLVLMRATSMTGTWEAVAHMPRMPVNYQYTGVNLSDGMIYTVNGVMRVLGSRPNTDYWNGKRTLPGLTFTASGDLIPSNAVEGPTTLEQLNGYFAVGDVTPVWAEHIDSLLAKSPSTNNVWSYVGSDGYLLIIGGASSAQFDGYGFIIRAQVDANLNLYNVTILEASTSGVPTKTNVWYHEALGKYFYSAEYASYYQRIFSTPARMGVAQQPLTKSQILGDSSVYPTEAAGTGTVWGAQFVRTDVAVECATAAAATADATTTSSVYADATVAAATATAPNATQTTALAQCATAASATADPTAVAAKVVDAEVARISATADSYIARTGYSSHTAYSAHVPYGQFDSLTIEITQVTATTVDAGLAATTAAAQAVQAGLTPSAGIPAATSVANAAQVDLVTSAGIAASAAASQLPTIETAIGVDAGAATATSAAQSAQGDVTPSAAVATAASASFVAQSDVTAGLSAASTAVAAAQAATSTSDGNATPGCATAAAASDLVGISTSSGSDAGVALATSLAYPAQSDVIVTAQLANATSGNGDASEYISANVECATGASATADATVSTSLSAYAECAAATSAPADATVSASLAVDAGTAGGSASALTAQGDLTPSAVVASTAAQAQSVAGIDVTSEQNVASAQAAALASQIDVWPSAAGASSTAAAQGATVATEVYADAAVAQAGAQSLTASSDLTVSTTVAQAASLAQQPAVTTDPLVAVECALATASSLDAQLSISTQAAEAVSSAQALVGSGSLEATHATASVAVAALVDGIDVASSQNVATAQAQAQDATQSTALAECALASGLALDARPDLQVAPTVAGVASTAGTAQVDVTLAALVASTASAALAPTAERQDQVTVDAGLAATTATAQGAVGDVVATASIAATTAGAFPSTVDTSLAVDATVATAVAAATGGQVDLTAAAGAGAASLAAFSPQSDVDVRADVSVSVAAASAANGDVGANVELAPATAPALDPMPGIATAPTHAPVASLAYDATVETAVAATDAFPAVAQAQAAAQTGQPDITPNSAAATISALAQTVSGVDVAVGLAAAVASATVSVAVIDLAAVAAGSLALAGAVSGAAAAVASGAFSLGGSVSAKAAATATGSVGLVGTAAWQGPSASGALGMSGTVSAAAPVTASGSLAVSGTGAAKSPTSASGSLSFAGTVTAAASATAAGVIAVSGSVSVQAAITPTGTLVLAGSATARAPSTAAGAFALAGTAAWSVPSATGSVTLAGTATQAAAASASGSLTLSSSAAWAVQLVGSIALTGSTSASAPTSASGSLALAGSASSSAPTVPTGTIALAGSGAAVGSASPTGALVLTGSAAAKTAAAATGALALAGGSAWEVTGIVGTVVLLGSATAQSPVAAAGSLSLVGTSSWRLQGVAGSLALSASATAAAPASAAGALALSGTAAVRVQGVVGSLTLAGAAATQVIAVSGAIYLDGSAVSVVSSVSGSLALAGSIAAQSPATAAGSIDLAGSAIGGTPQGSTGSLTLAGSATAASPAQATGSLTLAGSATARAAAVATGALTLTGSSAWIVPAASGSLTLAGLGVWTAPASGALTLSGTAAGRAAASATGSLVLAGASTWSASPAAGSIDLAGSALVRAAAAGTGALVLAGSASAGASAVASGSLALTGASTWTQAGLQGQLTLSAAVTTQAAESASGALDLAGAIAIQTPVSAGGSLELAAVATVYSSTTFVGGIELSASASAVAAAVGAGALELAGTAVAKAAVQVSGALALVGTAAFVVPAVTGSLAISGLAGVQAPVTAIGALVLAGSGAAGALVGPAGLLALSGTAGAGASLAVAGSLTLAGSAIATSLDQATGAIALAGSAGSVAPAVASGSFILSGSVQAAGAVAALGSIDLAGTATSTSPPITGLLVLQGTAMVHAGPISGSLTLTSGVMVQSTTGSGSLSLVGVVEWEVSAVAGSLLLGGDAGLLAGSVATGALVLAGSVQPQVPVWAAGSLTLVGAAEWAVLSVMALQVSMTVVAEVRPPDLWVDDGTGYRLGRVAYIRHPSLGYVIPKKVYRRTAGRWQRVV